MKKVNLILILFCGFVFTSIGQTVAIGTQVWMTKNLDVSAFRNGDLIPEAKTTEEWKHYCEAEKPAWCYYDNDPKNGKKYGKLYNWYAVNDSRGLAPEGWHVPSDDEWTILETYLGADNSIKMKSTSGWKENGNGTNSSGFSSLPGGWFGNGTFKEIGYYGYWWSSTEYSGLDLVPPRDLFLHSYDLSNDIAEYTAFYRLIDCCDFENARRGHQPGNKNGFSVRCLKD